MKSRFLIAFQRMVPNINDWNWNAIAAIGQWLGAIATFAAVLVALKQSRDASQARIKVDVSGGSIYSEGRGELTPTEPLVIFSATNAGSRVVTLRSLILVLPNKNRQLIGSPELPKELQIAEQVNILCPCETIHSIFTQQGLEGRVKVSCYFVDSLGNRYATKWKFDMESKSVIEH